MKLNQLLLDYVNQREYREREVGRYWASDLYGIIAGRFQPKDFFKKKKLDINACRNIVEGEIREQALKQLLDFSKIKYEYQVKKIWKEKDFEIVAISDFLFLDKIVECKAPMKMAGLKKYHYPQLEAQHRIFKKPISILYLKERFEAQFYQYKPSDKLWEEIIKKVKEFHQALKK